MEKQMVLTGCMMMTVKHTIMRKAPIPRRDITVTRDKKGKLKGAISKAEKVSRTVLLMLPGSL